MLKKIFIFIVLLILQFILGNNIFAEQIPVEKVFTDIDKNYKYYNELQTLYDQGMIFPDENGKLNPKKLLNRDEFVGIFMEVSCKKCISPNTSFNIIKRNFGVETFYDVNKNNKYFYCIAESDKLGYVKGYGKGYQCEGKFSIEGKRPFCIDNKITLDEALAVILRSSGIFTIEDNKKVISKIYSGEITENLSDDVSAKNKNGEAYTFYGYLQKALDFKIKDVDEYGNEKIYKLLELKDNKINPHKTISKEEFLIIAYIALKANSCPIEDIGELALQINILNKICEKGKECNNKNFEEGETIFDLNSIIGGVCQKGIENDAYKWTFYNINTGKELIQKGKYLDNYSFLTNGKWRIMLEVKDNCNNKGKSYLTIIIKDVEEDLGTNLGVEIDATPLYGEEDLLVEFEGKAKGGDGNYTYEWDFGDGNTGTGKTPNHKYEKPGTYEVKLKTIDGDGRIGTSTITIVVIEKNLEENVEKDLGLSIYIYADKIIGNYDLNVHFEGIINLGNLNLNGNYTYEWDFGDGNTGTGKTPNHKYEKPGTYEVKLNVIDEKGNTGQSSILIKVLNFSSCEIDTDRDGVMDCTDILPQIPGVIKNDGAPILEQKCGKKCSCEDGYECTNNNPEVCESEGICVPKKISLNECLEEGYNTFIYGNSICNSCPCNYKLDFLATIRKCDFVFPAITSPDSTKIYGKGNFYQIK